MNTTTTETTKTAQPKLYLYRIYQTVNSGWDTFDSAVVCAKSKKEARNTHPSAYVELGKWNSRNWANSPEEVCVEYVGVAARHVTKGIVCASFNAG